MEYRSNKGYTGWGQIGILIAFLAAGIFVAGIIQFALGIMMLPKGASILDADAMMKAMMMPQNVNLARISQVLSSIALLGIPAFFYNLVCNGNNWKWLGFSKHLSAKQVALAFVIMLLTAMAAGPLQDLSMYVLKYFPRIDASAKKMEDTYKQLTGVLSNLKSFPEYLFALIVMAFVPAIFEEMFFRGALQNILVKWLRNPWVAIIITSIVFSLIHSSIYLFLSRAALGFTLGLLYYYTKNIWTNIILHFINNGFALTAMYMMTKASKKVDVENIEQNLHWVFSIAACVALVYLFKALIKASAHNKNLIEQEELALHNNNNFELDFNGTK